MATPAEIKADLLSRLTTAANELAASGDGDTNEYVMRRYDEFERALAILEKLDLLTSETETPGPYEIITQGET